MGSRCVPVFALNSRSSSVHLLASRREAGPSGDEPVVKLSVVVRRTARHSDRSTTPDVAPPAQATSRGEEPRIDCCKCGSLHDAANTGLPLSSAGLTAEVVNFRSNRKAADASFTYTQLHHTSSNVSQSLQRSFFAVDSACQPPRTRREVAAIGSRGHRLTQCALWVGTQAAGGASAVAIAQRLTALAASREQLLQKIAALQHTESQAAAAAAASAVRLSPPFPCGGPASGGVSVGVGVYSPIPKLKQAGLIRILVILKPV
jgi:hypothetical protein